MNGCGCESITVEATATAGDGGYEALVTKGMEKLAEMLPGVAIHRRLADCRGGDEEWYIGCAHSGVSPGGQQIVGKFSFIRYTGEEL